MHAPTPDRLRPVRRRPRALALVWLAAALALAAPLVVPPAALAGGSAWVSTSGSDGNPGTRARPWRTLQKAANAAPAGTTVYVREGRYAPFRVTRPSLTFRPHDRETVVVDAAGARQAIAVVGTHDVTVHGLRATGAGQAYGAGILVEDATRVTVARVVLSSNRSFGIQVVRSTNVTVRDSVIRDNETGVQVSHGGAGVLVTRNVIRDNDRMVVNDSTAGNDRGANGVVLYKTAGPLTVSDNRISGHRARSTDYGEDGGAFEIYGASGVTIRGNRLADNLNVLETGTDGGACRTLRFVRNAVQGDAGGRTAAGLVLRCAEGALIAHNTFVGLTDFTYYVTEGGAFAGAVQDLRILNNISVTSVKTYSFASIPSGTVIDHNLVRNTSGGSIAWISGRGNTASLDQLRRWTGFDVHGTSRTPRFRDPRAGDLRLRADSPAIDRGRHLSGVNDGFSGAGPDLGRYER